MNNVTQRDGKRSGQSNFWTQYCDYMLSVLRQKQLQTNINSS